MHTTQAAKTISKPLHISLWIVQISLAAAFISAGGFKLAGAEQMITLFDKIGVGQWFRYVTGTIEVLAGVGLLVPRMVDKAAAVMALTMFFGFLTHITLIGGNPVPALVLAFASATVSYFRTQEPSFFALAKRIAA
ncbi:MAG: DoxX family protein [Burkholderiaceae bacterium]|nr:DoxX family protein [Burkholderiaceae bacterium]